MLNCGNIWIRSRLSWKHVKSCSCLIKNHNSFNFLPKNASLVHSYPFVAKIRQFNLQNDLRSFKMCFAFLPVKWVTPRPLFSFATVNHFKSGLSVFPENFLTSLLPPNTPWLCCYLDYFRRNWSRSWRDAGDQRRQAEDHRTNRC